MAGETVEERMVRIEERMDRQRQDLTAVVKRQDEQHIDMRAVVSKLDSISLNMNKLLWVALGGVGFFVLQQIGLLAFIKQVMGI